MKHTKLVIFFAATTIIYLIYKITFSSEITYIALGDSLAKGQTPFETIEKSYTDYVYDYLKTNYNNVAYTNIYAEQDYRITDLIQDIETVKTIKKQKTKNINQIIASADIITLSIGSEELFYKIYQNRENFNIDAMQNLYNYVDTMFKDYEILVNKIKKINKKPLIIIGYYNPITQVEEKEFIKLENLFNYTEEKFNKLTQKHNNLYYLSLKDDFEKKAYFLPNINDYHPSLEGYNYIANQIIKLIKEEKLY